MTREPHAQWLVEIEIVNAEELDVLLDLREQSALDADALARDLVGDRAAFEPVKDVGDAHREEHEEPLADAVDDGRMAIEERFLRLRFTRGVEGLQVSVAETTFDGRSLDRLAADRALLRVVAHTCQQYYTLLLALTWRYYLHA